MEISTGAGGVNRVSSGTSRWALLCGFGGLLILMAFAGFDTISALDKIRPG